MLQRPFTLITPTFPGPPSQSHDRTFSGRRVLLKKGFDLVIRYSSYHGTNYRTKPSARTDLLRSLETEYRELQDLRQRVRKAEAAAAMRLRPRGRTLTKR